MANARAQQNQQLFNQAAGIYSQLGMGVPGFGGKPGGGRFTSHLQNVITQGMNMLSQRRMQQMQQQMIQAQQAQASAMANLLKPKSQPKTLQSTLASGKAGVQSARSRTQKAAMQSGVRAANPLQAGAYLQPAAGGGGASATPYGSNINLA
jgi:hypothetical protein